MLIQQDPAAKNGKATGTQAPETAETPADETHAETRTESPVAQKFAPLSTAVNDEWKGLKRREPNAILSALVGALIVALVVSIIAGVRASAPRAADGTGAMAGMGTSVTASGPQVKVPAHSVYNAQPQAAPSGDSVNLQLTAEETMISIAPNVAYRAWTFNGTVPGPILRVRQGQTVNFTLKNNGTMGHSIDFHAAQVPPNIDYRPIAPGQTISFSFTPQYPGVFLYHCGMAPVMDHVANGMYGAIIVDPANGWSPAQEYVLVQSEFYTQKNADGSYSLNMQKMMDMQPDYVVFNGYDNQYLGDTAPLTAKTNQQIRLFVVNAGPSEFSAFHVIGAIFSDYYADGNPANRMQGDQTITIPPGGAAMVELTIPDAGSYTFVTHSFAAGMSGAMGTIKVSQ